MHFRVWPETDVYAHTESAAMPSAGSAERTIHPYTQLNEVPPEQSPQIHILMHRHCLHNRDLVLQTTTHLHVRNAELHIAAPLVATQLRDHRKARDHARILSYCSASGSMMSIYSPPAQRGGSNTAISAHLAGHTRRFYKVAYA